jgi:thymidylate kinase
MTKEQISKLQDFICDRYDTSGFQYDSEGKYHDENKMNESKDFFFGRIDYYDQEFYEFLKENNIKYETGD